MQVWKSAIALGISVAVLFTGLALTVASCPNGAPCPNNQANQSAGLIDIAGLILVPLSIVVWARQRAAISRQRKEAEEANALALAQRSEALSKMRVVTRNCPSCGAPLDFASTVDTDRVRCGYCGTLVVYKK